MLLVGGEVILLNVLLAVLELEFELLPLPVLDAWLSELRMTPGRIVELIGPSLVPKLPAPEEEMLI